MTISQLTRGTPSGSNLLPYSTGSDTLGTSISAIFQNNETHYIGIGTSAPGSTLHLKGPIGDLRLESSTVSGADWRILPQTGMTTKLFRIYDEHNKIDRFVINDLGNIGVGVLSPSDGMKLDVYGSTRVVGGLRLDYSGVNADPYVANIWTQGTLAASSSLAINMNGIAVNFPCAGIWLAFIQTDSAVINRNGTLFKATAMCMGAYMRVLGSNAFTNFTNMYTRDGTSLAINPPVSNDGQYFSFTNGYANTTCTYQIRTVPIMSNFRANT